MSISIGQATVAWKGGGANVASGNENVGTVTYTMTVASVDQCSAPCQVQVSVSGSATATQSSDFSYFGTKTIPSGGGSITSNGDYTVTFTVIDDNIDENDGETIVLRMNPDGLNVSGDANDTFAITDNDAAPTMTVTTTSMTEAEDTGWATVSVSFSHASTTTARPTFSVAVSGTATGGGVDYNALSPTSYNFASGATTKTFNILVQDDTRDEDAETIIFTITPSNATAGSDLATTMTINDNDAAPDIDFSAATGSASEGNS